MTFDEVEDIDAMVRARGDRSDREILDELEALPGLADESDTCWDDPSYWQRVASPYLALATIARERRLVAAVRLLLDRASDGDPFETMRGLRHVLEAIMDPDWQALADICRSAASSGRPGTVRWANEQLHVLARGATVPR